MTATGNGGAASLPEGGLEHEVYVKASNTASGALFGASVAVSGGTLVIGAPGEASQATGVDGDQHDVSAPESGAVYVFVRQGGRFVQQAYLKSTRTSSAEHFGASVAIDGDTIIVGAPGNGDPAAGGAGVLSESGAAYVFVRAGGSWMPQGFLKASNAGEADRFGGTVALSGDTVVVGAVDEDSKATGVDGDGADDGADASGAAYAFVRTGSTWKQGAYLKASNTEGGDWFGRSVAISGNTIVVGANGESSGATGVNGDQTNDDATQSGAAYVFVRGGGGWTQEAYLKASKTVVRDSFGQAVAVSGDTAVIGAPTFLAAGSGTAYVFTRSATSWTQQAALKASTPQLKSNFGASVGVDGDTLLVGAVGESDGAGAAHVFHRDGSTWSERSRLVASNAAPKDEAGNVGISGGTMILGAPGEASAATGIDGDESDESAPSAGAAYVFQ